MSTRIRQKNVTAAKWSANGEALGTVDLTEEKNNPFGVNVFSAAVQKDRLSKDTYKKLQSTLETGESLDTELADEIAEAMKEWALERGATHYTHVFQPLDRPDRGEARFVLRARRRGRRGRRLLRQGADPGRA